MSFNIILAYYNKHPLRNHFGIKFVLFSLTPSESTCETVSRNYINLKVKLIL